MSIEQKLLTSLDKEYVAEDFSNEKTRKKLTEKHLKNDKFMYTLFFYGN